MKVGKLEKSIKFAHVCESRFRIGAIAFGLGTLIYTGLEFLTFFETSQDCDEWDIILGINPSLYMTFVFMQVNPMKKYQIVP